MGNFDNGSKKFQMITKTIHEKNNFNQIDA